MAHTYRIAIVGCGRILPAHLRGYQLLQQAGRSNFRIVALCARNLEDALRFRRRGEGPPPRPPVTENPGDPLSAPHLYVSDLHDDVLPDVYDDWRQALDRDDIDVVDITASVPLHHEVALYAFARGKHVMVQKPLAVSVRAGRLMLEAARRHGRVLAVMENARYASSARATRFFLDQGELGAVQMTASLQIGTRDWSPAIIVADTPWRHDRVRAGGGASVDIGVHIAHRLRYQVGEITTVQALARTFEPVRHFRPGAGGRAAGTARADVDDAFFAHFEYANGAIGQATFTWAGHGEPTGLEGGTVIYGSRGCIKGQRAILDDGQVIDLSTYLREHAPQRLREQWFPGGLTDAFALAYWDFFQAIEAGGEPETSGYEGLRDLAVSFAILESSLSGQKVSVDDVLTGRIAAYQQAIDLYYGLKD